MEKILCALFILYLFINDTYGKRGFEINLDTINCTSNPKYISKSECFIDKTIKQGRLFVEFQTIHEVKEFYYSLKIVLFRGSNEIIPLINIKDGDGCVFLAGKIEATLVNIYRDILAQSGDLPKCPIPKGTNIIFKNIGVDEEKFPPYLPETKFALMAQFNPGKEVGFDLKLNGSVVQKRKLGKR